MKFYQHITIFILVFFILSGFGCTKVDTPIRDESSENEELLLIVDKNEILDTEPLLLKSEGGSGLISWETEPFFEDVFTPTTGNTVLFIPPDISYKLTVNIKARDESEKQAHIYITIIDEGIPPQPGDILINEIAWAGTSKSAYDEYIELINKTERSFYLNNWLIENAKGIDKFLTFLGKIEANSFFIIANYDNKSEKTSITAPINYPNPELSISNSKFGPFVLKNSSGEIFDTVGDGNNYTLGLNIIDNKASISRYTYSYTTTWDIDSWYTESVSVNLDDDTSGTPGAQNSDIPYSAISNDNALAIITEYFIDANNEFGEDWAELFITRSGNIKNFVVTDLDGTDNSITNGLDIYVNIGDYILVIWGDSYQQNEHQFNITDTNPTGTRDELVLLCNGVFLDGLCYSSVGKDPDDYKDMVDKYEWSGPPIYFENEKHASKKLDKNNNYINEMSNESWDINLHPTPMEDNK